MSGYTGGAFGATIGDDYKFEDFQRDLLTASPFVMALDNGDQYMASLLTMNEEIMGTFGRVTAYAERNRIEE